LNYITGMIIERYLLLDQLPAKLLRSVVQDALMANLPIPTLIIVGYRQKVISYYRTVDTIYALTA
jgi:hypothetical protein